MAKSQQFAIYADAGRREGLPIEAVYIQDLKPADRQPVDVSRTAITASENTAGPFRPRW